MRDTSRWLRRCAIVISVTHLATFVSFFFPNYWGWQAACQCSFLISPADLHLVIGSLLIAFAVVLALLVLPPLSAWLLVRFPTRLPGLFGLWLSLPLTSLAALYYGLLTVYEDATGFRSPFLFVYWIPPLALLLSFFLCLVLAILLPLRRGREETLLPASWSGLDRAGSAERADISTGRMRLARAVKSALLPLFALLGLLAHLLIFLNLFSTYIDYFDPYSQMDAPVSTTGWQLLIQAFLPSSGTRIALMPLPSAPFASVLLATLFLPALLYLVCLLLIPLKNRLSLLLKVCVSASYLLVLLGLLLSFFGLMFSVFSHGGDLHDPYQKTYWAFALPPLAFLFSLTCCALLLRQLPRRRLDQPLD